jgi:hypothetical protein
MVATNFFSGLGALLLLCVALAVLPIDVLTTLSHASSSQWVLIGVVGAIATLGQMPFGAVADPHAVQLRSDRLRRADQLAAVSTRAGRVGRGRHGPHRVRRRGNGLAQCAGSLERPRLSGTMRRAAALDRAACIDKSPRPADRRRFRPLPVVQEERSGTST